MNELFASFKTVGLGTLEIFLIGLAGFYCLKLKVLTDDSLKALSNFIVYVTFPFMIFAGIVTGFNIKDYPDWWLYPLASVVIIALGCFLGLLTGKIDRALAEKKEFISLMGFQNATYLPIPLVTAIFPKETAERFYIYIFLFALSYIVLISSVAVVLINGKKFTFSNLLASLSPPFYAIAASLLLAALGLGSSVPAAILRPMKLLGDCTIPLAMIVLGGVICSNLKNRIYLKKTTIFELSFVKLLLMPAIVFLFIYIFRVPKDLGFLIMLQATMPPATTLSTFAAAYEGNYEFIVQSTFYLYLFSIITIPVFIAVYFAAFGLI